MLPGPSNPHRETRRKSRENRDRLLQVAFREMHSKGFQGLRVDDVLKRAGLTKGAFYHYFSSKRELGLAVVEEVIATMMKQLWLEPLAAAEDPLAVISSALTRKTDIFGPDFLTLGCPLNNLAQEMSPVDEGFRERLEHIFSDWKSLIAGSLQRAQKNGTVRADIDADEAAVFIVAALEGCISLAKTARDPQALAAGERQLNRYLDTLRA